MNNGISPDTNNAVLVQWATRQLGLDETAPANAVRAAVRDRLAEDEFMPALRRQQAVQLLCRTDRPKVLPPLGLDDEEQRLREEIDEFAQQFFQLDCAERRRRWRALQRQCQLFPPLAARLSVLEAGLDTPGVEALPADADARELAEHLQRLFTARPGLRPGLRRSLLSKLEPEMDRWTATAVAFRDRYPPLAALDWPLVSQLAYWTQHKKLQAKGRRQRMPVTVESSGNTGGGSSGGGQYGWVVVMVVVALIRLFTSGSSSNRSPAPPTFQFTPATMPRWEFKPEKGQPNDELQRILKTLREQGLPEKSARRTPFEIVLQAHRQEQQTLSGVGAVGVMSSASPQGPWLGLAVLLADPSQPQVPLPPSLLPKAP